MGPSASYGNDRALLRGAAQGDESAFRRLVRGHHAALVRFVGRIVGPSSAEDVAQETWMHVLRDAARFEGTSTFRSWLFGVGFHRALDFERRERRERARVRAWAREAEEGAPLLRASRFLDAEHPDYPHHWERPPSDWERRGPAHALLSRERFDVLEAEFSRLPESQATVVVLRDFLGFETDVLARALGITAENVRILLHRGRARLWEALDDHERSCEEKV